MPGSMSTPPQDNQNNLASALAVCKSSLGAVEGAQKLVESDRAEHWPQLSLQLSETHADNGGYDNRQLPPYSVSTIGIQARTSHARIQSTGKKVQAHEKSRDAMGKSYELSVATIVDLLEVKKNLLKLKTRFERAQSRYEFIRSLVALKLWSSSLDDWDVEEINKWLVR